MNRLRQLRRRFAVLLPMTVAMLLISTQSAHATDFQNLWAWTKKTYVITHEWDWYNTTGEKQTVRITKAHERTVTAAIDTNVGSTGALKAFIAKLGLEVDLTLRASGSRTDTSSIIITVTIPAKDGKYVYYSGTRRASGRWERWACSSQRCSRVGYKTGHSFTSASNGSIACYKAVNDGLAKLAKREYC
ncbi:hypothetical protein ABZX77_37530 [Streptomyces sp. NPDC004237]|uniref:hypothetical protein n=1 Tax=Streptomyces sp. NPDC004237 TaxID=3154455 RepID=UPI0033B3C302